MKMSKKRKQLVLRMVRRKAGMPQYGKAELIGYVCRALQCSMPPTWDMRYELMAKWVGDVTQQPKPKKARPIINTTDVVINEVIASAVPRKIKKKNLPKVATDAFLQSVEWRQLRMRVFVKRGARCECCGATPQKDGITINVDHIKPRKHYPELALDENNLQILCAACNHGKGNWDETDWRHEAPRLVKGNTA